MNLEVVNLICNSFCRLSSTVVVDLMQKFKKKYLECNRVIKFTDLCHKIVVDVVVVVVVAVVVVVGGGVVVGVFEAVVAGLL